MSIGEQQRVAVARALAHQPSILLADEPTGSLDSGNSRALLDLLDDVHRRQGQTIVMITHSRQAADRAQRVAEMIDGKIVAP
jgi:putative ABC transport system ATP-binding protein